MISYEVERLINFALKKELIKQTDIVYIRNELLDILNLEEPYSFKEDEFIDEDLETAGLILNNILDYCAQNGIIKDNTNTYRDLMDAKIMGLFVSRPSEINKKFYKLAEKNKIEATDYFYNISKNSNYIQVDRIKKNLGWLTETEYGNLEITINLSKPEKDPRDIARARALPQNNYPKCVLCKENEGFSGNLNHPPRQNLRLIELLLNDEEFFFQYSPYLYYNEHCIVLDKNHVPMRITEKTFRRLLDFVEFIPHYFLGSNADIPIVGGSILSHDHYQGGRHSFPMESAKSYKFYKNEKFNDITLSLVKWPMSVIRISGKNKESLVNLSLEILKNWRGYEDKDADIIAYTDDTEHNTLNPIARINEKGLFEMDLVLRNNRTTKEYPWGIFHPHENLHHIKKENIGLIEVMGLAILPGRLKDEIDNISKILTGVEKLTNDNNDLSKHFDWIKNMINKYGTSNTKETADKIIKNEIGQIFLKVLEDSGVFKYTENGIKSFDKFILSLGFVAV